MVCSLRRTFITNTLLFMSFIENMFKSCTLLMFADVLKLYATNNLINDSEKIQSKLNHFYLWYSINFPSANVFILRQKSVGGGRR